MNKQPTFNEYAVIDLGSNSFHMIVARVVDGSLQILTRIKRHIHLATGLNADKELDQASIDRGVHCLKMFAERIKDFPQANVRIVATHALRIAKNRNQFLRQAAKVIPYPIEIISGLEEARLIYFGVAHTVSKHDKKLVIDIGGGSTEIAIGEKYEPILVDSRQMGCVTFTQRFFADGKISADRFHRAHLAVEQQLEKSKAKIVAHQIDSAFGTSGTIKCIHHLLIDMGVSDGIITKQRLNDLIDYLLDYQHVEQLDFPSLSKSRRELLLAGVAILSGLFEALQLNELHYSQNALREGVLYEMTDPHRYHDVRQRTALAISKQYHIDKKHAQKVVNMTKHLYRQWRSQTTLVMTPSSEALLYWAAMLHEVGLQINFSSIQKHSAYILQNSNLPGFNQEQQLLLATLVRYHRKSIKLDHFPEFNLFEHKQIHCLLQILRLAVVINNQRQLALPIEAFTLQVDSDKINHLQLTIAQDVADNNQLILLDLQEEQHYWQQLKEWQLTLTIQ